MDKKLYYVDTCIWLNLLKKEGDETKGIPYWKIAEEFLECVKRSEDIQVFVSIVVLRELAYLSNDKIKRSHLVSKCPTISFIQTGTEDYSIARRIEKEHNYQLSFNDCLHIALSMRLNAILVTRDKELLEIGSRYIITKLPEELF